MSLVVKPAETEQEFARVHALNLAVYARELGQDAAPPEAVQLVDPRLDRTVYIIAKEDDAVVGMLGLTPPGVRFSIEDSLEEGAIPEADRAEAVEVRRLAVPTDHRGRRIFPRILLFLKAYAEPRRYRIGYISAIEGRVEDYLRMGFKPFGRPFTKGEVRYQPMRIEIADFRIPGLEG